MQEEEIISNSLHPKSLLNKY